MRLRIANCGLRILVVSICLGVSAVSGLGQNGIPVPGPAKSAVIPAVKESKLKNGLTVAVVEKKNVPIVTVQLLVRGGGAASEGISKAGLADLTADLLTKGTKTRTAEQIAEQMEFLGGSIDSSAGWNGSSVTISVTSDKIEQAMAIMSDVVLNPSFKQDELDLLKSQTLDELKYNLTQPAFLASYLASVRSFGEHPAGGTPESISELTRANVAAFYEGVYEPDRAVLIFAGDITAARAAALAQKMFGSWIQPVREEPRYTAVAVAIPTPPTSVIKRFLVLDLPNAGQASVSYFKNVDMVSRGRAEQYYPASVLNSLLGGGYSSRLNQEIRIKRGLSYGAGSSFGWRGWKTNFSTRTQTKNESAAEVAALVVAEIKRLRDEAIAENELTPRRSVLTGGFGRNIETTGGLVGSLSDLYSFNLSTAELNKYTANVGGVTGQQINDFAKTNLFGGDMVIVGDYSKFADSLKKFFPDTTVQVIKASELDITQPDYTK